MEVLSEHLCQGWLEGYLLSGRHGFFSCYEAFIHIIDSMFNQHAKWLKTTREHPLAQPDRLAELPADQPCLAAGPQWLQPPGSWVHRPCGEQEGGCGADLSAARCQYAAVGGRSLPAQPQLRQCHRRRQAAGVAVARHGCGDPSLHGRYRHLDVGQQRRRRGAGRRHGVRRRCAHAGDARRGRSVADAPARSEGARGQRGRPDDIAAGDRASAWPVRLGIRFDLHARQAGDLCISRLSVADPSAGLSAVLRRSVPCARLQGGRHDDDAVRHDGAQ